MYGCNTDISSHFFRVFNLPTSIYVQGTEDRLGIPVVLFVISAHVRVSGIGYRHAPGGETGVRRKWTRYPETGICVEAGLKNSFSFPFLKVCGYLLSSSKLQRLGIIFESRCACCSRGGFDWTRDGYIEELVLVL